jgi:hypothetical protein
VHHRCITGTALGASRQNRLLRRNRMVEPKLPGEWRLGRRIRLRGLLRESPAFAGLSSSNRVRVCITGASRGSPIDHRWTSPFMGRARPAPHGERDLGDANQRPVAQKGVCLLSKMTQPSHRRKRDVRVELVGRSGLFGRDARRSCNSCRRRRAVDSAQRFRSSSKAEVLSRWVARRNASAPSGAAARPRRGVMKQ